MTNEKNRKEEDIIDYLDEDALCLIEWPEKGAEFLPKADLELSLGYEGEQRSIKLKVNNPEWSVVLEVARV